MCGIVGYAGEPGGADALDVVLEGLRRLEYRGYDSAGVVAVIRPRRAAHERRPAQEGRASWPTSWRRSTPSRCRRPSPGSGTPAGPRTAGRPTPTPTRTLSDDGRLALIHNGIIENFAALKAELLADGVEFASETDTEVAAHLLARAYDRARRPDRRRCATVCNRLEGAFTLLAVHADAPGTVVGARRNSPLVVGRRRRRELPRLRRRRVHRAHPGRDRARPGPGRHDHARRRRRSPTSTARPAKAQGTTTSTGTPPPPRRAATRPSWPRRSTSSRRRSPTRCSAAPTPHGRLVLDELRIDESVLRSSTRSSSIACGTAVVRRPGRQVRDRALVPDPDRGRAGARVPLPRPGRQREDAGRRDLAVRRDDGHAHGGAARPRAGRPGARDLQHPRLDDPARVRRRALHARRPGDRGRLDQGVPRPDHRLLPARALPRPAARQQVRRRGRARSSASCAQMPAKIQQVLDATGAGAGRWRAGWRTPARCSSSAGTSASRSRWRARSSSRSSPTSTPRASRPASSSTARSR